MDLRRRHRSVTLLELIIASAIAVVVLLAMFSLMLASANVTRQSAERAQATNVAEATVAELRAKLHEVQWSSVSERRTQFLSALSTIGTVRSSGTTINHALVSSPETIALGSTKGTGLSLFNSANEPLGKKVDLILQGNAKVVAYVSVWAYAQESLAETALGLTASTLDINGNGTAGETLGSASLAVPDEPNGTDMYVLPIQVTVAWRRSEKGNANTSGPDAWQSITISSVLY